MASMCRPSYGAPCGTLLQLLQFLLCHPSWNVRKTAYNSVTKIFLATSQLATTLLDEFSDFLFITGDQIVSSRTSDADNFVDHQVSFVPSVEVLVKALIVISSAVVTGPPSSWIVRAIFCSHHPSVLGTGKRKDVWKHLQDLPDKLSHDMLSETDIKSFHTPEAMLLSEQGIYVAQTIGAKYTSWSRYLHGTANHSLKKGLAGRETANLGRRDTAKLTKGHYKGKTAKEESRELMLKEEASTREIVHMIQKSLSLVLHVLGEIGLANPVLCHSQLPFLFLPRSLAAQFQKYLQLVLPAILDGFADENESVHDAALGAGHILSLLGPMGLMSPKTPEQQAAVYSLSTMMSLAPEVTFTVFKMHLQDLPDRLSHNMLSETDIKIFHTPEGMLLSEQGIYVAQTIGAKYTKQEPSFNPGRQGITLALQSAADNRGPSCCYDLFDIPRTGISSHLADPNTYVRGKRINAGIMIIDKHGKENASDEEEYDLDDPKVHNVVEKLLEVLNTPSESVKRAVSTCPSPLVLSKQEDAPAIFLRLLDKLMKSDKYGERRGAAFGLAGVVMGFGISSLKKYGLIVTLQEALKLTDEPGKQVCSAIKLKNTSKSHTAFKFDEQKDQVAVEQALEKMNRQLDEAEAAVEARKKPPPETGPRVVGEGLVIDEWVLVDPIPETSNHSLKKGLAGRETTNLGRRDTAKLTKKAEKGKTAKEEARELMLKEEASKKSFVGEMGLANPVFCHSQLPFWYATFLDPLLRSPIVSAAAFENLEMLARCTVQPLCNWALEISTSLRLTAIDELDASSDFRPSIDKIGKTYEDNYKWCTHTGANFTVIKADKLHSDALYGVYSKDVHVRMACLNAVKCIPAVSKCSLPQNGIALALQSAADVLTTKDLPAADPNTDVHGKITKSGNMMIDKHGKENVSLLFPIFENYLNKEASDEEEYDLVRGVVIFSGALSKMLLLRNKVQLLNLGLEDKAWRTKQSSVQLLGAMAFSVPQQLSQCLPRAVPKLTEVLTDTHPKVQSAGQLALQYVIKNPEISSLVPTLLLALTDPSEYTRHSLDILLQTAFVNSVDGPSLALLPKDMFPYIGLLLPEVLVDPIPEVLSVAARAVGSLIRGMGEDNFPDLVPWLFETLKSDISNVERSGAAQGLSEVIAALGTDYFENILPDLIRHCSHQKASVRDGYLTLFKFLPRSLGAQFEKYLQLVLPAILNGLAHENESVRDAALGAGHVLVEHHATTSLPLIRPVVEDGIFNANWRIRQSFVELLGDLLFKLAGRSLGELVRKLGERVLPLIIPKLSKGLTDPDVDKRQDVCIGLNEVMATAGRSLLLSFMDQLIPTIRTSLCDSTLYKSAGLQAMDEIIPTLLEALEDDEMSTTALDGLKQIISVRTAAVLPHILSKLVHLPLSYVAGAGFNTHLGTILPILLSAMGDENKEVQELAQEAAERVVLFIDEEGVEKFSKECLIVRSYAYLIGYFFKSSKLYLIDEAPNMISTLIVMLSDSDSTTVTVSWETLARVIGSVPKEVLPSYIKLVRDVVSTARDQERMKRKDDLKVHKIVEKLLEVLNSPSESVQRLSSFVSDDLLEGGPWPFFRLLDKLMESDKYGERREAAFGVERVVMGFGISSLTKYGLIVTPQEALIDSMCRPSCGAPCGTLLQLLLFLVFHPSWNVRKTVYNFVTKIFLATSQLATTLLDEFSDFLSITGDQIVSSRTRCVSEGFDYHSVAGPSSSWIVRAIFYLHHPSIVGTRKRDVVWKRLQNFLKPRGYDVATFCLPIEKVFARDDIVIWVQKKTGAPIITLNSVVEAQRFLNKFEGSEHNEFVKAAKSDDEIQFVETSDNDVEKLLIPDLKSSNVFIGMVKIEAERYTVYDGSYKMEKILEFLGSNKFPLITKLTDTNTVWVYSSPVMLFSKADDFQKLAQALEDIELCSGLAHGVVSRYYKSEPVPYNSSNHSLRHSRKKREQKKYKSCEEKAFNAFASKIKEPESTKEELTWHLCSDADNPVDHQAPFVPSVEVLVKALIVISSAAVTGPPSSWIVRAIFCSHHPSVVGTGTREDVWKIFQTPEGMILNEQAIYVAQTIGAKYTNQEPAREAANSGRRDTAKLAKKAGRGTGTDAQRGGLNTLKCSQEMPLRRWVLLIMCFVTASYLFERIIHSQWLNQQMIYGHGHDLGTDYSGIFKALSHINLNINWSLHFISLYIRDATSGEDVFDAGWMGRQGIALALQSAADVLTTKDHPAVMTFLISRALADPNTYVRGKMINAGIMIIDKHGKENASDEEEYDLVREGVVIFTGSLAKHLAKDDPKVHNVVENLLEVLNTPSDSVQRAVLTCLSPLVLSKQAKLRAGDIEIIRGRFLCLIDYGVRVQEGYLRILKFLTSSNDSMKIMFYGYCAAQIEFEEHRQHEQLLKRENEFLNDINITHAKHKAASVTGEALEQLKKKLGLLESEIRHSSLKVPLKASIPKLEKIVGRSPFEVNGQCFYFSSIGLKSDSSFVDSAEGKSSSFPLILQFREGRNLTNRGKASKGSNLSELYGSLTAVKGFRAKKVTTLYLNLYIVIASVTLVVVLLFL
ncbi:unnamed protein product [Arabidopsis arenosa]|uniref:TOG domain-containing protein n=1 Tax=Arabidopsis arenosa TaxID=38785 RepID=A0A8S1ZLW7_ARAAE|nr:unnamed protein product [Arabidopsis arenosa]